MKNHISTLPSVALPLAGAWLGSLAGEVMPYALVCTAIVLTDCLSAVMLRRRLKRLGKIDAARLSSHRFGRVVTTLIKIYALLVLSYMIDTVIIGDIASWGLTRLSAALVCFWQAMSILENEATASDARWARIARKILVDKTERHLGIDLSEMHNAQFTLHNHTN